MCSILFKKYLFTTLVTIMCKVKDSKRNYKEWELKIKYFVRGFGEERYCRSIETKHSCPILIRPVINQSVFFNFVSFSFFLISDFPVWHVFLVKMSFSFWKTAYSSGLSLPPKSSVLFLLFKSSLSKNANGKSIYITKWLLMFLRDLLWRKEEHGLIFITFKSPR